MKYTLAIAALVGLISIEQTQAITVFTTSGAVAYESSDSSDSSSEDEDVQMVQMQA